MSNAHEQAVLERDFRRVSPFRAAVSVVARHGEPGRRVVLYTSSECWRGAAVSYVNIARGLERHGFEAHVVALEGVVADEFREAGISVSLLKRGRGESWRLRRFLSAFDADVVIVDRSHDLRVGTLAVAGTRVALINRYNICRATAPADLLTRVAYHAAVEDVIFLSTSARRQVLGEAPFMRRVRPATIHEGVDPDTFRPSTALAAMFRRQLSLGDTRFLLAVGALSPEKRYDVLFEALHRLGHDAPLLLLFGEGAQERELQALASAKRIRVQFAGRIPQPLLVGAYNAALGLVHMGAVETFGLAILEAMACGRPIVAAAGGAVPEVLGESGDCGTLVPPSDAAAAADAIRRVLDEPRAAHETGARARLRAASRFSLTVMQDGYADLIARHTARA